MFSSNNNRHSNNMFKTLPNRATIQMENSKDARINSHKTLQHTPIVLM